VLQLAENLKRLGTETAFEVLARAGALEAEGKSIVNLGIGQPDFKTPDHIVEAALKALRDGHHGYTPANGIPALREAVAADLHKRHGVEINPDNVVVVPGGKVTMFFAIMMFGEPGAEIMYPDPGFPIYKSVIDYCGAKAVPIVLREENEFTFSAEEVLAQITPRTRLIIVNSPANPTGGTVPRAEWDMLVEGLQAHPNVAVLSDEIYSQMLYEGREHVSILQYESMRDRAIMLDGWSKTYAMTGWWLGFAVWPESIAAGAEPDPGLPLRRSRRRVLRLPQHRGHRPRRPHAAEQTARRSRRGDRGGNQLRRLRRGLHPVFLRKQRRKHSRSDQARETMLMN
jgi:aspartate/methionine/tyrosine aminotransferase